MALKVGDLKVKGLRKGDTKGRKAYLGDRQVWSAGNTVTYVCAGVTYQEEREEGESVLTPKTFTPTKSGWMFKGWSNNKSSSSVLSSLAMGDEPVTLYAVFQHPNAVNAITMDQWYWDKGGNGNVTLNFPPDGDINLWWNSGDKLAIDTSLYSAATVNLNNPGSWSNWLSFKHNSDSGTMYFKVGSAAAKVVSGYHPANDSDATKYIIPSGIVIPLADEGKQFFKVRLDINAGYYNGWSIQFNISSGATISLTGRTTIG